MGRAALLRRKAYSCELNASFDNLPALLSTLLSPPRKEMTIRGNHILEHSKGYQNGYLKGLSDGRDKQIQELRQEIKQLKEQNNGYRNQVCKT